MRTYFSNYRDASAFMRGILDKSRLSPAEAKCVRAAVEKHNQRQDKHAEEEPNFESVRRRNRKSISANVTSICLQTYRTPQGGYNGRGGHCDVVVTCGSNPSASGESRYVSTGGKYASRNAILYVCVSHLWDKYVRNEGLAIRDGMLTTHAKKVETRDGVAYYKAAWVRQGVGFDLVAERGFIAFHAKSGTSFHAKTLSAAKAGMTRKFRDRGLTSEERTARSEARERNRKIKYRRELLGLAKRVRKWDFEDIADVEISLQDSYRAGNCKPGTLSFRDRIGMSGDRTTIGEFVNHIKGEIPTALKSRDLELARQVAATMLVAIRRHKNQLRTAK